MRYDPLYICRMEDKGKRGPINRPQKAPRNQIARRVVKAAVGSVPGAGAALSELADATLPDYEAKDRMRWEGDVTDGVNSLHGRVEEIEEGGGKRSLSLTGASAYIAKYMIERCPDGLAHDFVSITDVQEAYPELSQNDLRDGFGDLESYGLIESSHFIGAPPRYVVTQQGYEALDEPVMGWNTEQDARKIADIVVRERDNVQSAQLEQELGWSRRRLNPALRIVVDFIDPGRVSQTIQPDYVTRYFSPSDAERARLRRFALGE
jgi:hypothetical protein